MQKRLRVFAGPNGSGKSSIIQSILEMHLEDGRKLDFGTYINADEIAVTLKYESLTFTNFGLSLNEFDFLDAAEKSGLVHADFTIDRLKKCLIWKENSVKINHQKAREINDNPYERIAQLFSHVLREKLLELGVKISFETVFSHVGKIDFIKRAQSQGYKVYLYFVSTESPEINVYRVKKVRVAKNGHDVPEKKIIERYQRSMDQLYEAAQYCYQCYFFDNSKENARHNLFAHFKLDTDKTKKWQISDFDSIPNWFRNYYSSKVDS